MVQEWSNSHRLPKGSPWPNSWQLEFRAMDSVILSVAGCLPLPNSVTLGKMLFKAQFLDQ